jgi:hypothetical protein
MTRDHKILYKGKMVEAYKFMKQFENVHSVKYNGEVLYNVLLKSHGVLNVNGLVCETLDPENIMAKLYSDTNYLTDKNIVSQINSIMINNFKENTKTHKYTLKTIKKL